MGGFGVEDLAGPEPLFGRGPGSHAASARQARRRRGCAAAGARDDGGPEYPADAGAAPAAPAAERAGGPADPRSRLAASVFAGSSCSADPRLWGSSSAKRSKFDEVGDASSSPNPLGLTPLLVRPGTWLTHRARAQGSVFGCFAGTSSALLRD